MTVSRFDFLACVVVWTCALVSPPALAQLTAYEPFDYAPAGGDLIGRAGGGSFGFASPWAAGGFNASVFANYDVAADSLTFGNLLTSGGRARSDSTSAIAGLTRALAQPLGASGTTRYYSFLLRPEGTLNAGAFNGFFGLTLESAAEPEIYAGKPGGGALGSYVIEQRGGASQVVSPAAVSVGETALLVVRADFQPGVDTFTLYVNPSPGGPEPSTGTILTSPFATGDALTLYSTGEFSVDELRVGTTFADVTPIVPEPSAAAVAAAPLLLALRRRRAGVGR